MAVDTPPDMPVSGPVMRPAAPGEGSDAAEAAAARETIGRLPRQRAADYRALSTPPTTQTAPVEPGGNFFSQFRNDPKDDGIAHAERMRLNRNDAYYRGSIAGAMRLSALAHIYQTPDGPDVTPERKAVNEEMRKEYQTVVADLAAYDETPGFKTTAEALVAFGGQLEGTMVSPESWIGWGAKGASWLTRTRSAAVQQGAISGAIDPAIQQFNIQAGVRDRWDPMQTVLAAGLGGVIGGGGQMVGEGAGQLLLRRQLADLAKADSSFANAVIGEEMLHSERSARPAATVSRETPAEPPPAPREYEPGPVTSFDDVVKRYEEQYPNERKRTKRDGKLVIHGVSGKTASMDARWAAFREETGEGLDVMLRKYDLSPETGVVLADYYDRRPGENPMAALERAIVDGWYPDVEAMAIKLSDIDTPESILKKDWEDAERNNAEADRQAWASPYTYEGGKLGNFGTGLGELRTPPGMSSRWDITGRIVDHDAPFEPAGPSAKSGDFPESGRAQAGEQARVAGGGEGGATGGGRGGERPGAQAAAIGTERLGGPDERTGGAGETLGETRQDQAQAADTGTAAPAKLPGVGPVADTRGGGTQYHGSGNPELRLDNSHYSSLNYYGQGFYSTDAVDVGGGYARSKRAAREGGQPTLYRIEETRPLNILDGEQPFPDDVRKVLEPVQDYDGNPIVDLLRDVEGRGTSPKNMRELYDALRDEGTAAGYNADDIQAVFDSINVSLRELGYNGLSHQGGLRTKKAPHRVVIYFDPEDDIRLVKEAWPGEKAKEPDLPASDMPLAEPPKNFPGDPFDNAPSPAELAVEPPKWSAKDMNAVMARMSKEDAEEFNLLWAMGANDGTSAIRDTVRFVELADKYKEAAPAPKADVLPEGTRFKVYPHDGEVADGGFTLHIESDGAGELNPHYRMIVEGPEGREPGNIAEVFNESRAHKGLGVALYERAMEEARARGMKLNGFGSPYAQRVWQDLEKRGLAKRIEANHYEAVDPPVATTRLVETAIEKFGLTTDMQRAGFILPDGRMLDWATVGGQDRHEHIRINQLVDEFGNFGGPNGFSEKTGALRIGIGVREIAVSARTPPTPVQISAIVRHARKTDSELSLGYYDDKGGVVLKKPTVEEVKAFFADKFPEKSSLPATERTAQGEQTLIPGVAPITDRQRLEAEGAKPMRGGDAPPGGMFDTDARAQGDLLGSMGVANNARDTLARAIPDDDVQNIAQRRKGGRMEGEAVRPEDGVAGAPSPEKDLAIRSLQQMSFDLAKALDFPLRQGRVTSRGAAGQFSNRSGVARVLEVPDFEVVSHEAAHALEARIGKPLTDLTEQFSAELARMDYDKTKMRVNEGFAEWMRAYLNNPAYADQNAPGFTVAFRAFMQKEHPDLMAALDATAASKLAFNEATSVDGLASVVRHYNEDGNLAKKTMDVLRNKEMPAVIKGFVQQSYDALFDRYAPMTRAIREMATAIRDASGAPVELKAAYNPEKMIRLLDRSRQGAVNAMQYGVIPRNSITPEGAALTDALVVATGQTSAWGAWDPVRLRDFDTYLIARRAIDLWRRFDNGDFPNPPVSFSRGDAAMAMRELDAAFPTFRQASDMVQDYARQILRKKFESGLLNADSYQKILDTDGFYVPFYRDRRDLPGGGGTGTGGAMEGGPGLVDPTHRIKGSSRDIYSPIESLMRDTFLMEHQVRLNDIVNALGAFGERAGIAGGKYIERIPAFEARKHVVPLGEILENKVREMGMTPEEGQAFLASMGDMGREDPLMGSFFKMEQTSGKGEPIVFSRQGGELVAWRVMSEKEGHPLFELLTAAPDTISDVWVQTIGFAAGIKRAGITTNPVFAVSNYIRDQFVAAILRPDYIPILSGLRGMYDEATQTGAARQYSASGGVAGGAATGPVDRAVELEVDALRKRGFGVQRLTSWKGLLELASFTEAGTRNSIVDKVFAQKKKQGLSDVEALAEAVNQAQDIMDFSRHGSRTLALIKMIPFLNATGQGLDKARRTMIEPLWQRMRDGEVFTEDSAAFNNALLAWAKFGGLGAAAGATWAAINWEKESYRDASTYFKATHVVVPYGKKIIVVPKPFELGLGFTAGEYAFARLMKEDERAGGQFMEAAWDVLKMNVADIPLLTSGTEIALGKSMFTGRDIVPGALQGLPSEMQFTERTSEMAKWVGQQTGMSPIKVEYFVGSQFGNWGRDALALSQGINEDAPAKDFDDRMFLRRFVKDPTRSSDAVTKFWDFMGRTTGKYNQSLGAYDSLVKGFQEQKAAEFLSKLPAAEKAFVTLRSAAEPDGKPAFSADEKRLHPLQRAYDAVNLVNGLRKELATNNFAPYETSARTKLDPETRRDLLDNIRELGQMEMRNALAILGEPGFKGRPILDVSDVMLKIQHLSPEVARELATRYATAKIYKTSEVAKVWPRAQTDLVRFGSGADVQGFSYAAKQAGYEFDGTGVRKPAKRRVPIQGSPAGASP